MKILMVSSYLPYPLFSGGHIRLYNLIKNLSIEHEITLVCEKRDYQTNEDIKNVEKICSKVYFVERKKQWSSQNIFKTAFSLNPFLITGHKSSEMKRIIEGLLENDKFDLIHVETFYVMQNLPKTNIPIILVEHNVEYMVYKRYADKAPIIFRPFLFLDVLKIKRIEMGFWSKVDALVAVSESEQKIMGEKSKLVPNGVDSQKFSLKKIDFNKKEKRVLFIGDFKWIQNRDTAIYIIKNIWPLVLSKNKNKQNIKLWIVGKNIPDTVKSFSSSSIIFDENAPDETELIFKEADILLSPIRVGGGTNFKILESMSCGTPVLTNHLGNEGLEARNNEDLIICEEPSEFAQKIVGLLVDRYLYEKISRNARNFIEENYDWKRIAKKLDKLYTSLNK